MTQIYNKSSATPKQAAKSRGPLDKALDADLFKALGDPTRLKLLACLAKCSRPCSVTEVAECSSIDFSVVSRHLAILFRAGIVKGEKSGRTVFYEVKYREVSEMFRALSDALSECCSKNSKGSCCVK